MSDLFPKPAASEKKERNPTTSTAYRLVRMFGGLSAIGTIAAMFASDVWIADLCSHFRMQYLLLLLPWIAWEGIRRKIRLVSFLFLLWSFNAIPIVSHWMPVSESSPIKQNRHDSRKLVSFNVLRTNEMFKETLELMLNEKPDFIFMMEVQEEWKGFLEPLRTTYPYQKILAVPDYTGVAFLSKFPWENMEVMTLGVVRNPSLIIEFPSEGDSEPMTLIATHPLPPFGSKLTQSRDEQLLKLANVLKGKSSTQMIGDFNLSPWSPRFRKVLLAGDLEDASRGRSIAPTLTPLPSLFGGVKVDHVLVGKGIEVRDFRLVSTSVSDHQMVVFEWVAKTKM